MWTSDFGSCWIEKQKDRKAVWASPHESNSPGLVERNKVFDAGKEKSCGHGERV